MSNLKKILLALGGGLFAGNWLSRIKLEESKKSRAELEAPEASEEAYKDVLELLSEWKPEGYDTEKEFTEDLFDYLKTNLDWKIEQEPSTREGKPDILVEDLIVLELKVNPGKAEQDRAIGQCAGYSREWITLLILIDTPASAEGRIEKLLIDKGLEQIEIHAFV